MRELKNGDVVKEDFIWPDITRRWWQAWADSPLTQDFTEVEWYTLLEAAMLHARFWTGDTKVAGELRQRVSKFGATAEDRAKLRIQFATAVDTEDKVIDRAEKRSSYKNSRSRARSSKLKNIEGGNNALEASR